MDRRYVVLETATGPARVDLDHIDAIGAPWNKGGVDLRAVGMGSGLLVYALNTPENLERLEWPEEAARMRELVETEKAIRAAQAEKAREAGLNNLAERLEAGEPEKPKRRAKR